MAAFNQLPARLQCPRCGRESDMMVDLYFGLRDQLEYKLGDTYRWRTGRSVKNGGRPPEGNLDGEGYTECPLCRKDFFVIVRVRNDVLQSVEPNTWQAPLKLSQML